MTIKTIKIPIYPAQLVVIVCDTVNEGAEYLKIGFSDEDINHWAAFTAKRTYKGMRQFAVVLTPETSLAMIVHEVIHLKNMVLDFIGQRIDPDNDEAESYLSQWLFNETHKVYDKAIRSAKQD
jgi:hypothetical protein